MSSRLLKCLFLSLLVGFVVAPSWNAALLPAEQQQKEDQKKKEEEDEKEPTSAEEKAKRAELEQKACGPKDVKHSTDTDKTQHPTPQPPPGKAMIYVVRPTMMGNKVQTKLAVDGKWVGINRGNNYFFFELDPGEHHFCSQAENRSIVTLNVEAGKTYFLQQKVRMGFMKAGNRLATLDEAEGKEALAKTHLATFTVK